MVEKLRGSQIASLVVSWVIWAMLLLGQVAFVFVEMLIVSQNKELRPQHIELMYVNAAMLVVILPVAFLIRHLFYRKFRTGGAVHPGAFFIGNLIVWAGCDGVTFFGLVCVLISVSFWPYVLIPLVSALIQILAFPRIGRLRDSLPVQTK